MSLAKLTHEFIISVSELGIMETLLYHFMYKFFTRVSHDLMEPLYCYCLLQHFLRQSNVLLIVGVVSYVYVADDI